jgi:hypothetical protein
MNSKTKEVVEQLMKDQGKEKEVVLEEKKREVCLHLNSSLK